MNRLFLLIILISAGLSFCKAQILKPSISNNILPLSGDSICPIPVYTGSFASSGYQPGDTVADFTLYTINNDTVHLLTEMQAKKPVLLVTGSYTCPVFRNRINELNTLYAAYQNDVLIYVVYVVEAHPKIDNSPYSGTVWTTSQNQLDNVLYRQPQLYGHRKQLVSLMTSAINIDPPVLIDGPCNEWWLTYGPAPNNAYLIDTNGVVFSKHDWFNKPPLNMACDIDSLLQNGTCAPAQATGDFIFTLISDSVGTDIPANTIYVKGWLINTSTTDPVMIDVVRTQENVPSGWSTAICTDICLPDWLDSTEVYLYAGDSQLYTMYFYTDPVPGFGSASMIFKNRDKFANRFSQNFYGSTLPSGLEEYKPGEIILYPNPAGETAAIRGILPDTRILIYDLKGGLVKDFRAAEHEPFKTPTPGMYFVRIISGAEVTMEKLIVRD